MLSVGWDNLSSYDEVICMNDTIMGPLHPFAQMFTAMDKKNVDFWGITSYPAEILNGEEIPNHLQAFWHAYRSSLVSSQEFQDYWNGLLDLRDYKEVTHEHEMKFTKRFEQLGFTWASYVDEVQFKHLSPYPMLYTPVELLRDSSCPVFKRRSFFLDYDFYFDQTAGQPALNLYEYIRDCTDYDEGLIWDAILPFYNISDIARAMHLNYVLPKHALNARTGKELSAAFIFHIYFLDMLSETTRFIKSLPESVDLYVTCAEEKIEPIRDAFTTFAIDRPVTFIPVKNRGRDVSALLVGARDVVLSGEYDVVGFAHDKKSSQNQDEGHHGSETQGFTYKLMENVLGSQDYVKNVLTLFADNPHLGLACPPPPFHALYFPVTMPLDWGPNFESTKSLLEDRLGIHVPLDSAKPTRSALGSCYWFRANALKPLFQAGWQYEDFLPEGVMGPDGSISHAIERANGYIVQSQGYYPAWVMSDHYARIEVDSLFYGMNSLLNAIGSARKGPTIISNCGELRARLRPFGQAKWMIHRVVSKVFRVLTKPLPDGARVKLKRAGWFVVDKVYAVVRFIRQ